MVSQERELFSEEGLRAGIIFREGGERELQEKRRKYFVENLFPGQENALRKRGHKSREEMWPLTFSSGS